MVFRDYLVRCKRCRIPYHPDNVSRIRTCRFCRKSDVEDRSERLRILEDDIKRFMKTQNRLPKTSTVKKWIKLKFGVCESTVNSYLNELRDSDVIEFIQKEEKDKVKLLNFVPKASVNT